MKWLVYGARGWIGQQVVALLAAQEQEVVAAVSRVDDEVAVAAELAAMAPDRVVCLTGRTHGGSGTPESPKFGTIDYLEQKGKLAINVRDNLYAPVSLALLCQAAGIHYTLLNTGCIFEYDEEHPRGGAGFTEADKPNFFASSYSVVKGFTDRLLHRIPALVLRLRMPITGDRNGRNFISKIIQYEKVVDIPNSMSVLSTLLPILVDLARKQHVGVVNFVNPGAISHSEVLQLYKEIVDPSFEWQTFSVEEQEKILLAGRSNCYLDTTFLEKEYPTLPSIKEAVRQSLVEMKARDDATV